MIPTKAKGKNADASFAEVSERDRHGFLRSTGDTQRVSRRGGAGQNPSYDIDLEGFSYEFPASLFQAFEVGRCHMLIERTLTCPCFAEKEASPRI
jgi:hypothetical protein